MEGSTHAAAEKPKKDKAACCGALGHPRRHPSNGCTTKLVLNTCTSRDQTHNHGNVRNPRTKTMPTEAAGAHHLQDWGIYISSRLHNMKLSERKESTYLTCEFNIGLPPLTRANRVTSPISSVSSVLTATKTKTCNPTSHKIVKPRSLHAPIIKLRKTKK